MLHEDPEAVQDHLTKIKEKSNRKHFVVTGNNVDEAMPVLMYLIQQNLPHLSVLRGGYPEFHQKALQYSLPISGHTSDCYICHPKQVAMKQFLEKTKNSVASSTFVQQNTTRIENWFQQLNQTEEDLEMPPSNIIEHPKLKEMLFSLSNPLLFCTRVLSNHERREG
uniref:Uncharacterized protein n=1 Tax=Vannella robusta TaxID=1487602 RepID=A0A7S4HYQ0_9EUKA|mmetsp:Transcript_17701/g.22492  ORF Transcript_17701/g.22492 Transcript_17701/m.22492 type:complete len:166 (+) Transcript_17701:525-1022(+)